MHRIHRFASRFGLRWAALAFGTLAWATMAAAAAPGLIADDATLQQVSDRFEFTEGPAADADGNVYFTDQPNDRIWRYGSDGELTQFMQGTGRANGLYFDPDGNLVSASDAKGELWRIGPDKQVTVLVDGYQGHRLNGPNDLWIDADGGIYFTDPYYQRDYWTRTEPDMDAQRVYYLAPGADAPVAVIDDMKKPNGLIGTPDGETLYVSDFGGKKTYAYHIADDGRLTDKRLFTDMGSDGMTLDAQGNVYLTGDGVTVFNPQGEQILHIPVAEEWTANVTFGGPDDHTLFITASKSLYTLHMNVAGARTQ